jgi:hypothetical protein
LCLLHTQTTPAPWCSRWRVDCVPYGSLQGAAPPPLVPPVDPVQKVAEGRHVECFRAIAQKSLKNSVPQEIGFGGMRGAVGRTFATIAAGR